MEIREPEVSVGKTWAVHAAGGSMGRLRREAWVEVMVLPSGRTMEMLGEARRRLWQGAWIVRMNAGAAVSAIQAAVNME